MLSINNKEPEGLKKYDEYRFLAERPHKTAEPLIMVGNHVVGSAGNIIGISGGPKTGKSFCAGSLIAANLTDSTEIDTLGFTIIPNKKGLGVLYVNTELSTDHFFRYNMANLSRAQIVKSTPRFYWAVDFVGMSPGELIDRTIELIHLVNDYCGTRLIVIDGIADFVDSVNDEAESNRLVTTFHDIARKLQAVIVFIIHNNPGNSGANDQKARGHLGSQIARKCESLLEITKVAKKPYQMITHKHHRNSGFDPIYFQFDPSKGYPVFKGTKESITLNEKESANAITDAALLAKLKAAVKDQGYITSKEALQVIEWELGTKRRSAQSKLKEFVEKKLIVRIGTGLYEFPKNQ